MILITIVGVSLLQFYMATYRPLANWPKWLACVSLFLAGMLGIAEILNPELPMGERVHPEIFIAALLALVYSAPAWAYLIGRILRWVIVGPRHTPWNWDAARATGRFVRRVVRGILLGPKPGSLDEGRMRAGLRRFCDVREKEVFMPADWRDWPGGKRRH